MKVWIKRWFAEKKEKELKEYNITLKRSDECDESIAYTIKKVKSSDKAENYAVEASNKEGYVINWRVWFPTSVILAIDN